MKNIKKNMSSGFFFVHEKYDETMEMLDDETLLCYALRVAIDDQRETNERNQFFLKI